MKKITRQEFIDSYKDSVGQEGAVKLMKETLEKLRIADKEEYTKEEAIDICNELKKKSGFIGIVAGILLSRFHLR